MKKTIKQTVCSQKEIVESTYDRVKVGKIEESRNRDGKAPFDFQIYLKRDLPDGTTKTVKTVYAYDFNWDPDEFPEVVEALSKLKETILSTGLAQKFIDKENEKAENEFAKKEG